jgi:hypothetical protein
VHDCVQILIDNRQHYKVLGKAVELTTLIRLQVRHGKVVDHQDWSVYIHASCISCSCFRQGKNIC